MTDVYSPPQSDLQSAVKSEGQYGSVENAIHGNYDFEIWESIKESWLLVKGVKGSFWGALVIYYIIMSIVMYAPMIFVGFEIFIDPVVSMIWTFAIVFGLSPITFGLMMLGVKRSVQQPVSFTIIFDYYSKIVPLVLLMILSFILVGIGFILLVIPGIYLGLAYIFAFPLMLDRNMGIWEALETSRKAVTKRWFKILGYFIVTMFFVYLGLIPFGIGMIWTAPLGCIAYGVLYRNIFGVSEA